MPVIYKTKNALVISIPKTYPYTPGTNLLQYVLGNYVAF